MELEIIKHKNILFRDLLRAIAIKTVVWIYPLESQIRWIVDNMCDEDEHVFLKDRDKDLAYMTLSPVTGLLNGVQTSFSGVGCVCSAHPGSGGGKTLLSLVNQYLVENNKVGILFCKDNVKGFYIRCNWNLISPQKVSLAHLCAGINTMMYNHPEIDSLRYDDRNF